MDLTTPAASNGHSPLALATGEACTACGARLAADQRYCVECGDRRGQPRLPFMDGRPRHAPAPVRAPRRRRPQASAGATLVAGVGTLLLAMGVGVLIGRSGGEGTVRSAAPAVQVVTVPGAGAVSMDGASAADGGAATKASSAKQRSSDAGAATPKAKLPPPTVTVGAAGHGRGYKNGKFTGDFFGP